MHPNQHSQKKFSKELCKKFSISMFEKILNPILISFENEPENIKKLFISNNQRRQQLINFMMKNFADLEFNPYQIATSAFYCHKFLSCLVKKCHKFSYMFLKSIIILSITAAHKITCDYVCPTKVLQKHFNINNLGALEKEYYEMIGYKLFAPENNIMSFYNVLMVIEN